jgi:serine/threonine protein phosphatase PrpC
LQKQNRLEVSKYYTSTRPPDRRYKAERGGQMGQSCSTDRSERADPADVKLIGGRAAPARQSPTPGAPTLLSALEAVLSSPRAKLGEGWKVVPRMEAVGDGSGQAVLFLGPGGFCVVQPDGHRSQATCTATLEALQGLRRASEVTEQSNQPFDDLPDPPTPNTVRRLQNAVEVQLPRLNLLSSSLRRGEIDEIDAARELLNMIGSYELRLAVFRAIGRGNAALLRARQHKILVHESSARSLRVSGRLPSARGNLDRRESVLKSSARGVETKEVRKIEAAPVALAAPPPSPVPYACGGHEGGAGGQGKENQDTYFTAQPLPEVAIFAVFDGHGKQNGQLAAQTAARVVEEYLCTHAAQLLSQPNETLAASFAAAHAAIGLAMMERGSGMVWAPAPAPGTPRSGAATGGGHTDEPWSEEEVRRGGFPLELIDSPDGGPRYWDAADGGTTATVAVVLHSKTLVLAAVGDSSAVVLGRRADGGGATGLVVVEEHGATNPAEYTRLQTTLSPGQNVRFVYECPGGETVDIFAVEADGSATLDTAGVFEADRHDCAIKTARGDLCSVILVPERTVELPPTGKGAKNCASKRAGLNGGRRPAAAGPVAACITCGEQGIAMTRSLGDFYAHSFGVSSEPEIVTINLHTLAADNGWADAALLLASDGIWDLWEYKDVAEAILKAEEPTAGDTKGAAAMGDPRLASRLGAFCERTRAMGESYFGECADNLTGVLIGLSAQCGTAAA